MAKRSTDGAARSYLWTRRYWWSHPTRTNVNIHTRIYWWRHPMGLNVNKLKMAFFDICYNYLESWISTRWKNLYLSYDNVQILNMFFKMKLFFVLNETRIVLNKLTVIHLNIYYFYVIYMLVTLMILIC